MALRGRSALGMPLATVPGLLYGACMPLRDKVPPGWSARPGSILTGHTSALWTVAIAPDGTWLATASNDKTARIWAADGTPRATLTGHTDWVTRVAIAPDGTWLATAGRDGTVRTWAADGTPRTTLTGHDGKVFG